jgi:hypothetical protein
MWVRLSPGGVMTLHALVKWVASLACVSSPEYSRWHQENKKPAQWAGFAAGSSMT